MAATDPVNVAGAKDSHDRRADGGRDMHHASVVAYQKIQPFEQGGHLLQGTLEGKDVLVKRNLLAVPVRIHKDDHLGLKFVDELADDTDGTF